MKFLILFFSIFIAINSFAVNNFICATENQWPSKNNSGWLFAIDPSAQAAFVYKMENVEESLEITRQFSYSFENNFDTEYVLTSKFGDEVTLQASNKESENNVFYGVYQSNGKRKEEFKVTCYTESFPFPTSNQISLAKNLSFVTTFKQQLEENYDHRIFVFEYAHQLPFDIFARLVSDRTVSDVGDWESTVLSKKQENLVMKTLLKEDSEFLKKWTGLKNDEQNNADVKILGLLFARDWYSGDGRIGLAVKYKNQVIVLTHAFSSIIRFGDNRLDYIY